jgi:hypothetical protein
MTSLSQHQTDYDPKNLFTTIDCSARRAVRFNLNHESLTHEVRRSAEHRILVSSAQHHLPRTLTDVGSNSDPWRYDGGIPRQMRYPSGV